MFGLILFFTIIFKICVDIQHYQQILFIFIQQMPIRQGKAKLWFNTKEQKDEFDDKMIANVRLNSNDSESESFNPIFVRKRQQIFLKLNDQAKSQINKLNSQSLIEYIDKYHIGKRDHSYWRELTIKKFGFFYAFTYLLIRELPIRNFYARCWIMLFFMGKLMNVGIKGISIVEDEYTNKSIKNYNAYVINRYKTPPTLDGQLPEEALWKMNQPGFLKSSSTSRFLVGYHAPKTIEWDGTFNMPLEGLASPKHKDGKFRNFIYEQ